MTDVVLVLLALAFLGGCVVYVRACDRLIGADPEPAAAGVEVEEQRR